MSWAVGYDSNWKRDIGYGVPAVCDHPDCSAEITRGLAHVCGGQPYGGDEGCGLYFCSAHLWIAKAHPQMCERCSDGKLPFKKGPDVREWLRHKLRDPSWQRWREKHPHTVQEIRGLLRVMAEKERNA